MTYRLQLWDIAGQDRFHKLTRVYFKNAVGAVIVCDVSRERTVDAIKDWKAEIDNWMEQTVTPAATSDSSNGPATADTDAHYNKLPIVLFANKSDLLVSIEDAFAAGAAVEKVLTNKRFVLNLYLDITYM